MSVNYAFPSKQQVGLRITFACGTSRQAGFRISHGCRNRLSLFVQCVFIAIKYLHEPQSQHHKIIQRDPNEPRLPRYLAVSIDSVGVQSVRVRIVESLSSSQLGSSGVPVSEIIGTGTVDTVCVGLLVKDSGGLVLSVAGRRHSWELREEDGAVGDVACRGDGVCQDIGIAAAVLVVTVGGGGGGGAAAVTGDGSQTGRNSVLGGAGRRLEVGGELGTCGSCGGSRCGKLVAVGERSADGGKLGAGTAGANSSALVQVKGLGDPSGLGTIHSDGELLGVVRQSAEQLGGVLLGVGDQTTGKDLKVTTVVQRVKSSGFNGNLLCLAGL